MELFKNWDVFMMVDIYMDWIFFFGVVFKYLKNLVDVVVLRFVCLYDEFICNVSIIVYVKCIGFRVMIYLVIRYGNLSRIFW